MDIVSNESRLTIAGEVVTIRPIRITDTDMDTPLNSVPRGRSFGHARRTLDHAQNIQSEGALIRGTGIGIGEIVPRLAHIKAIGAPKEKFETGALRQRRPADGVLGGW